VLVWLWFAAALTVASGLVDRCLAAVPQPESRSAAATLRRYRIEPSTAGVLQVLRQWQPNAEGRGRIARLVRELGSASYETREAASQQLAALGTLAEAALREATQSDDMEVAFRARRLLADGRQGQAEELLAAALEWLRQSPSPQATPLLLDLLPVVPDAFHQPACEALWAAVGPDDALRLRQAVGDGRTVVRCAAIPALELAAGAAAVSDLEPLLRDGEETVRLAAVRALLDRLPQPSLAALLGLLDARDPGVREQAAWLLQQVSGIPSVAGPPVDFAATTQRWKDWAGSGAARHPQPLGPKRLQATRYGTILLELFADEAAGIAKTYRQLQYETNVGGAATVTHGVLRLDGNRPDGDQRLCATAQKLLGVPVFPRRFQIKVALGGESQASGLWHAGVSVGNARLLFHPGLNGGQFRVERVDNHQVIMANMPMSFTPATDVLHEMTIDVAQNDDGSVRFEVLVADGAKSGKQFRCSVTASGKDVGAMGRIGLERSGQPGGAALFAALSIRHADAK
jgi:hypothetical protein